VQRTATIDVLLGRVALLLGIGLPAGITVGVRCAALAACVADGWLFLADYMVDAVDRLAVPFQFCMSAVFPFLQISLLGVASGLLRAGAGALLVVAVCENWRWLPT